MKNKKKERRRAKGRAEWIALEVDNMRCIVLIRVRYLGIETLGGHQCTEKEPKFLYSEPT